MTTFPTALDNLTNPSGATSMVAMSHAGLHANANDCITALEEKVGINGSAVTSSHDYKIAALTTAVAGKVGTDDARLTDARTPTAHNHDERYYTEGEMDTALSAKAATSHTHAASDIASGTIATARLGSGTANSGTFLRGDQSWATPAGGDISAAWPINSVFITVVDTNPATLLGFGTWVAIAAGRVLVGQDTGDTDFDTLEETGGAKTVTLTEAQMPSHTHIQNSHVHVQTVNSATTGGLSGYTPDTSSNTPAVSGYSTQAATAVNQNTGGGAAHPNVPPYCVVKFWKRTA